MVGNRHFVACEVVVPMHTEQVARVSGILVDTFCDAVGDAMWFGQFAECRKNNFLCSEAFDAALERLVINHPVGQAQLLGESFRVKG